MSVAPLTFAEYATNCPFGEKDGPDRTDPGVATLAATPPSRPTIQSASPSANAIRSFVMDGFRKSRGMVEGGVRGAEATPTSREQTIALNIDSPVVEHRWEVLRQH